MTSSIARRRALAGTAAALALVLAPAATAAEDEYVPFVTDFPKPASAQQFVPFVTDFGMEPRQPGRTVVIGPLRPVPPTLPAPDAAPGRSWSDVGLGASLGLAGAALAALGLAGAQRLRRGQVAEGRPPAGAVQ